MSITLNSAPIAAFQTEQAAKRIWLEWLTTLFNGAVLTVGTAPPIEMPLIQAADVQFDGGSARQPLVDGTSGHEVRIIHTPLRTRVRETAGAAAELNGSIVYDHVALTFWITCRQRTLAESNRSADLLAQVLFDLLLHPETRAPLARLGIHHVHPQHPTPLQSSNLAVRLVRVQAQYHYALPFSG